MRAYFQLLRRARSRIQKTQKNQKSKKNLKNKKIIKKNPKIPRVQKKSKKSIKNNNIQKSENPEKSSLVRPQQLKLPKKKNHKINYQLAGPQLKNYKSQQLAGLLLKDHKKISNWPDPSNKIFVCFRSFFRQFQAFLTIKKLQKMLSSWLDLSYKFTKQLVVGQTPVINH